MALIRPLITLIFTTFIGSWYIEELFKLGTSEPEHDLCTVFSAQIKLYKDRIDASIGTLWWRLSSLIAKLFFRYDPIKIGNALMTNSFSSSVLQIIKCYISLVIMLVNVDGKWIYYWNLQVRKSMFYSKFKESEGVPIKNFILI